MKRLLILAALGCLFAGALSAQAKPFTVESLKDLTALEGVRLLEEHLDSGRDFTGADLVVIDELIKSVQAEKLDELETQVKVLRLAVQRRIEFNTRGTAAFTEALKREQADLDRKFAKGMFKVGAGISLALTAGSFAGALLYGSLSASARIKQLEAWPGSPEASRYAEESSTYQTIGYTLSATTLIFGYMLNLFESAQ